MSNEENVKSMIQTVIEQAEKESAGIIKLAERAKQRNLRPYSEKAKKLKKELIAKKQKVLDNELRTKKSDLELRERFFILQTKEKISNQIYETIIKKIEQWADSSQYREFIENLLQEHLNDLKLDSTILEIRSNEKEWIQKKLKQLKIGPELQESNSLIGGLIIKNHLKHFIYDYNLESIFNSWYNQNKQLYLNGIYEQE